LCVLSVQGLFTEYPNERGEIVKAAQDVSFTVAEGQLFTLLGPSGCGKTTTLRSIAGLERPRAGEISVNGQVVFSSARRIFVAPNRRGFGMVFQSYAIWPHMTVFENAAFPLQVRGAGPGAKSGRIERRTRLSRSEVRDRVMRVLEAVQLGELAEREATKLSGGQQQRLALARALVMEPALLLLDEPLSNLDAKLRERMRFELKRLQRELKITTVYVTHDQSEALALSRQIAVMSEGRILQIGTPRDIYERPASQFVADFVGNTNFIDGVVKISSVVSGFSQTSAPADHLRQGYGGPPEPWAKAEAGHYVCISTELGDLQVQTDQELRVDERVAISVRPEDVELTEARPPGGNVWEGRVDQKVFLGEAVDFQVKVGPRTLLSRRHPTLRTKVGDAIFVQLNPEKCVLLKVA
jgi:iron(III) transport system ATP-binding protein